MHKLLGIAFILNALIYAGCGVAAIKLIDRSWRTSRERKMNPDLEGPSGSYIKNRKFGGAILFTLAGICMLFAIIELSVSSTKGTPLSIEGEEMKFPCTYSDIQAMGYELVAGQEIVEIKGTNNSLVRSGQTYKVVNDSGKEFEIRFENNTPETKLATECYIYEMTFEYAAPKNPYGDMSTSSYLYSSQLQELGMSQDEINQTLEDMSQKAEKFEEQNKPMNSPKITLDNGVSSCMDQKDVTGIMGSGTKGSYTQYYHNTSKYVMKYGDEYFQITISYVSKDKIAKITIKY